MERIIEIIGIFIFVFLAFIGIAVAIFIFHILLVILRFLYRIVANKTNPQIRTFRIFGAKIKSVTKGKVKEGKEAEKRVGKEFKDIKKKYEGRIMKTCKNFARALKMWHRHYYHFGDLYIVMGIWGKFALYIKVFFCEAEPYLEISESINPKNGEKLYLKDFSEEKLGEMLKKQYWGKI